MSGLDPTIQGALDASVDSLKQLEGLSQSFGRAITSALTSGVTQGTRFQDVLKGLVSSLDQMALQAAMKPLSAGISSLLEGVFGSVTGKIMGPPTLNADGGVLNAPAWFPDSGGLALAGEAGPEAVMPLARGPDGKLGVRGGGSPLSVTVNISTPDADSFRRSESLVAASLARAVARGQRAL